MMKKDIHKIILIFLCPLFLTACLSEDPKGQIKEPEAYNTSADIERNLVGNLYNYIGGSSDSQGLQGTFRGGVRLELIFYRRTDVTYPRRRLVRRRILAASLLPYMVVGRRCPL